MTRRECEFEARRRVCRKTVVLVPAEPGRRRARAEAYELADDCDVGKEKGEHCT